MSIDTLTWSDGDSITSEKLQTMVQAIRENEVSIPRLYIQDIRNGEGGNPSLVQNLGNNLKMVAGSFTFPPDVNADIIKQPVYFESGIFSPGNSPIVLTQLISTDRIRTFTTVGPLETSSGPTEKGFNLWIAHQVLPPENAINKLTFASPQTVFWLAIGY